MTRESAKKEFVALWDHIEMIEEFKNAHEMDIRDPFCYAIDNFEEVIWHRMIEIIKTYPEITEEVFGVRYYIKNGYIVKEDEDD